MERDPVQLLEALLTVCEIAAVPSPVFVPTLRGLLRQLCAEATPASESKLAVTSVPAENGNLEFRMNEEASVAPVRSAPTKPPAARLPAREWLALRKQVMTVAKRRGLDHSMLAVQLGLAPTTLKGTLGKRTPPSGPITARLRAFLAPAQAAPVPAPASEGISSSAPPAPAQGGRNGAGAGGALDGQPAVQHQKGDAEAAKVLAAQLKAKRRLTPLTAASLAEQIGVEVGQLDAAIAGRAVPPVAAERLQGWLAAG